jgi:hypothetical protein
MKIVRFLLFFLILLSLAQPLFSFPLDSQDEDAFSMELIINFGFNPLSRDSNNSFNGFEFNFYFPSHFGFGFTVLYGELVFVGLNAIYLANPVDNDYVVVPVKLRLGVFGYFDQVLLGGSLSSGAKGLIPLFRGRDDNYFFLDMDLLASGFFYINRFDKKTFDLFAEGAVGSLAGPRAK